MQTPATSDGKNCFPEFLIVLFFLFLLFPVPVSAKKKSYVQIPAEYADMKNFSINTMRRMLKEGVPVNAVDKKGSSLLMLASYEGDMDKVKYLIGEGADVNQRNEKHFLYYGDTPLDYAIRGKHEELVDLYLSMNVDVNAKFRRLISTIYKCGMAHNYEMLRYLLVEKKVVVSDEDKINTMIITLSYYNAPVSSAERQIIALLLQDLEVEAEDLWKSSLMKREDIRDVKKVEAILQIQDSERETKKRQAAEQRAQDSLKMLLESGKADTLRYNYVKGMIGKGDTWRGKITVIPRVDVVENEQGNKSAAASWILLGFTILLVHYCCRQIMSHVYKERPAYLFPYIAIYLIGSWVIYSIFSCIYLNLDEIMMRKYGEEKIAALDSKSSTRQYRHRGAYHTYYLTNYHFVFTGNDSIRIAVNRGNICFDADDYTEEEQKHIKVRYDSASHKLAVDNDKYFMQNLIWISFMFLLLLLILMFSWGVFNSVLYAIQRKMNKWAERPRYAPLDEKLREPLKLEIDNFHTFEEDVSVDTFWKLSSKEYQSMKDFIRDVQRSEQLHRLEPDERIKPDRILFNFPNAHISLSDEYITGDEDINILLVSDNGLYFTEGELLFKLHHAMIPYLDRIKEDIVAVILPYGYLEGSDVAECVLMFQSEVE